MLKCSRFKRGSVIKRKKNKNMTAYLFKQTSLC